jgi:hypothetical protein
VPGVRRGAALGHAGRLAFALAAAVTAACDPCSGVASCRSDATVSGTGRILQFDSGVGAANVRVTFRPDSGPGLVGATELTATTNNEGYYELRGPAADAGLLVGTLTVSPPEPRLPYQVPSVPIRATTRRGDGSVLPTFLERPFVAFVGELRLGRSGDAPTVFPNVSFVRTGGPQLERDTLVAGGDAFGRFYLEAPARSTGAVIGTLTVSGGNNTPRPYRIEGVALGTVVAEFIPDVQGRFVLGAAADGDVEVRRTNGTPVVDALVVFQRTGGLALLSDSAATTTGAAGRGTLVLRPVTDTPGEVVGQLTVRLGGAIVATVESLRIRTNDAPIPRVIATVTVR